MFKRIFVIIICGVVLVACNNDKVKEKTLLQQVITYHDKAMADDNIVMKDKMMLRSIAVTATANKDSALYYSKLLDSADSGMMVWMNKFNPDLTGRSHQQVMAYLTQQKSAVAKIDSGIKSVISVSNKFIAKCKSK